MVAAVTSMVSAQAIKGYQMTVTQGTYTALTDGTVITSGNTDVAADKNAAQVCFFKDGAATEEGNFNGFPIGFNFKFGDKTVTTFGVSGSGFIILRGDEAFSFAPDARHYVFTVEDSNRDDVAGIALPMNGFNDNTKISYKTAGTAGSRTLTIELANILISTSAWNMSDTPGVGTIQYILSEADNSIKVVLNGWKFEDGDSGSNCRFALRGKYNEGPQVLPFENEDWTYDWARSTSSVVYTGVSTINYGDECNITDGLTFTFNYPADVVAPTTQPTNLELTATPNEITYAFDTAEGADTYLVLYTKGMDAPAAPQNGVTYEQGDKIGACTVAYLGAYPEEYYNRVIKGLDPSSKYTVYVMAANAFGANGPAYLSANPLSASVMTAPEAPASVTLTGSTKTTVSGTCEANSINDEVIVVYTTKIVHNFPMASTADYGTPKGTYKVGDTVEEGHDGKVAYIGPAGAFTCDNLPASSPVFVAVFSHDANGEYSAEAAEGMTATTCEIPFEPDLMAWAPYMDDFAAGWDGQHLKPNWTTKTNEETGMRENIVDGFLAKNVKGSVTAPVVAYTCTPLIDIAKDAEVTFDWNATYQAGRFGGATAYAFSAGDTLRIEVSEDANAWTTIAQVDHTNAPQLDPSDLETYTPMKARLNDYIGKQAYVRIYFVNTQGGWGATLTVKNFAVKEYVAPEIPVVTISDIKAESAVASWDGTFEKYDIEYQSGSAESGTFKTQVVVEGKTYTMTALTALTDYVVRVRGIYADETPGEWSEPVTFTTTDYPAVTAPTNLAAVVNGTSVALSWDNNDEYVSFTVRYRPTSVTKWTEISDITENSCTLKGLDENTAYYWTVKAACTHERTTSWATQSEFTTGTTTGIVDNTSSELRMAVNGNSLTVLNPGVEIGTIGIFDAQGRTVGNYTVNAATNVTIPMAAAHTIYIVKVETANGTRTYRIAR